MIVVSYMFSAYSWSLSLYVSVKANMHYLKEYVSVLICPFRETMSSGHLLL